VTWAAAAAVALAGFAAVVLYRYVDVGRIGPIPNMYEPTWLGAGKLASAWAEGAAALLAIAGLVLTVHMPASREPLRLPRRVGGHASPPREELS
jgi:hypothetical protein